MKQTFNTLTLLAYFIAIVGCGNNDQNQNDAAITDLHVDGTYSDQSKENDTGSMDGNIVSKSIVGDWFRCEDKECKNLFFQGWRANDNGTWSELFASDKFFPTDQRNYCYMSNDTLIGTYTWDGSNLVKKDPKWTTKLFERTVKITDGIAEVSNGSETWYEKRVPISSEIEPCSKKIPWVCVDLRKSKSDDNGQNCYWKWVCDNGEFVMECEEDVASGDYDCTCTSNDDLMGQTTFKGIDVCNIEDADPYKFANTNCNWNIWTPFQWL